MRMTWISKPLPIVYLVFRENPRMRQGISVHFVAGDGSAKLGGHLISVPFFYHCQSLWQYDPNIPSSHVRDISDRRGFQTSNINPNHCSTKDWSNPRFGSCAARRRKHGRGMNDKKLFEWEDWRRIESLISRDAKECSLIISTRISPWYFMSCGVLIRTATWLRVRLQHDPYILFLCHNHSLNHPSFLHALPNILAGFFDGTIIKMPSSHGFSNRALGPHLRSKSGIRWCPLPQRSSGLPKFWGWNSFGDSTGSRRGTKYHEWLVSELGKRRKRLWRGRSF